MQDPHTTLRDLKAQGFKVYVSHTRPLADDPDGKFLTRNQLREIRRAVGGQHDFAPSGGMTTVTIRQPDGTLITEAYALCNPSDRFNKRYGLTKALGRAMSGLHHADLPTRFNLVSN